MWARPGMTLKPPLSSGGRLSTRSTRPTNTATSGSLNHPEVAIVGPNKIAERVVVRDGQMVVRKTMNLSSSFDHRIVDGHDAAVFVQRIKGLLEHPATLWMN